MQFKNTELHGDVKGSQNAFRRACEPVKLRLALYYLEREDRPGSDLTHREYAVLDDALGREPRSSRFGLTTH